MDKVKMSDALNHMRLANYHSIKSRYHDMELVKLIGDYSAIDADRIIDVVIGQDSFVRSEAKIGIERYLEEVEALQGEK